MHKKKNLFIDGDRDELIIKMNDNILVFKINKNNINNIITNFNTLQNGIIENKITFVIIDIDNTDTCLLELTYDPINNTTCYLCMEIVYKNDYNLYCKSHINITKLHKKIKKIINNLQN